MTRINRFLAFGSFALVAALMATPNTAEASPSRGTVKSVDCAAGQTIDIYNLVLVSGEITRIRLVGAGNTCLELRVFDENGNMVASDTLGMGDVRSVVVQPRWTGRFTVKIRNLGVVSNCYVMIAD